MPNAAENSSGLDRIAVLAENLLTSLLAADDPSFFRRSHLDQTVANGDAIRPDRIGLIRILPNDPLIESGAKFRAQ